MLCEKNQKRVNEISDTAAKVYASDALYPLFDSCSLHYTVIVCCCGWFIDVVDMHIAALSGEETVIVAAKHSKDFKFTIRMTCKVIGGKTIPCLHMD